MANQLISSDNPFSIDDKTMLRAVANTVIPPSPRETLPGADDDAIFPIVLARAAKHAAACRLVISRLDGFERDDEATRVERLTGLWQEAPMALAALVSAVCSAYYEDDRVLTSLGYETRAPFPRGHELAQGDWSLLDPVRARKPFYRPA